MRVKPNKNVWVRMMNINQKAQSVQTSNEFTGVDLDEMPDEDMFAKVDDEIASMAVEFAKQLPDEILKISEALSELEATNDEKDSCTQLFRLVHDLKGIAGTFDYMLITVIANEICCLIEPPEPITADRLKVVRFHVEAMKLVQQKRMTGTDNPQGVRIVDTLQLLTKKVLQEEA